MGLSARVVVYDMCLISSVVCGVGCLSVLKLLIANTYSFCALYEEKSVDIGYVVCGVLLMQRV